MGKAQGMCDGTGAAINVCLGVIPTKVIVRNNEDAGSKYPVIEWTKEMGCIAAVDEGVMETGTTDSDREVVATAGISAYAGGTKLVYDGVTNNRWEYPVGTSAEEVYVDGYYTMTPAEFTAGVKQKYQCYGDARLGSNPPNGAFVITPPGFTIGTNADLNQNGEQLTWEAEW
jgi:hypothetical protein